MCEQCDAKRAELIARNPKLAKIDQAVNELVGMEDQLRKTPSQEVFDDICDAVQAKYELEDKEMTGVTAVAGYELGIYTREQVQLVLMVLSLGEALKIR